MHFHWCINSCPAWWFANPQFWKVLKSKISAALGFDSMHTSKHVSAPRKHFLQPNRSKGQRASAGVNTITNSTSCRCTGQRKPGVEELRRWRGKEDESLGEGRQRKSTLTWQWQIALYLFKWCNMIFWLPCNVFLVIDPADELTLTRRQSGKQTVELVNGLVTIKIFSWMIKIRVRKEKMFWVICFVFYF